MAFSFINLRPQEQNNSLNKLQDIGSQSIDDFFRQRQNQKTYQDILGLDPNTAKSMANYDLPEVMQLLQALGQREGGLESLTGLGSQQQMAQQQMMPEQKPGVSQPLSVAQALGRPTKAQQREDKKLDLKERQVLGQEEGRKSKESLEKYKIVKPYLDELYKNAEDAAETLTITNRMKELEGENLTSSAWNEFLNEFGIGSPAAWGEAAEEFLKLRQGFLKGAREAFGGRVSNYELEQFLKTIPDLGNSPEGRKRIIANIQRSANLSERAADIANRLIEENNGEPPLNLRALVDKEMKDERKVAIKQFKEDLKRPVPQGSSGLSIAGAKLAGKGLKGAAGAIPGAIAGSFIPGVGTLLGGLAGGALTSGALSGLLSNFTRSPQE